jgi:hypothetical protein
MPTTESLSKQFALIMSEDEHRMLTELAERDGRSAASWIRVAIQVAYERRGLGGFPERVQRALDRFKVAHDDYLRRADSRKDAPSEDLEAKLAELRRLVDAAHNRGVFGQTQRYLAELTTMPELRPEKLQARFDRVLEAVDTWVDQLKAKEETKR